MLEIIFQILGCQVFLTEYRSDDMIEIYQKWLNRLKYKINMHLDTTFNRAGLWSMRKSYLYRRLGNPLPVFSCKYLVLFPITTFIRKSQLHPKYNKMRKSRGAGSTFPLTKIVSWVCLMKEFCVFYYMKKMSKKLTSLSTI